MKYLFINVVAGIGSTGRIAAEKCRELQAQGHECVLAYGRAENGCEGIRFHDLRHSHATILFANNMDAVAVASRLGHGSAVVTLREYAHALRRRDRESAQVMQSLILRAWHPDSD